jgi:hypothetical protein
MLIFIGIVSFIIAVLIALMYRPAIDREPMYRGAADDPYQSQQSSDSKLTLGIKTFIVAFVVIYFGLVFFTPQLGFAARTQLIETCEPDF